MRKRPQNIRTSEATREQLAYLATRYGTITTAIAVAVDLLYREQKRIDETLQDCTTDQA